MSSRHTGRYAPSSAVKERFFPVSSALRETFREGYGSKRLQQDVLAGVVVGIVALPLSMALAIASGVPPQHGLYTAIVAGGLIALTGGSRLNISGPTAAFVILLAPISAKHGIAGLALASAMAGVILLVMGFLRLGKLVQFVPYPVTTGFTAGIAVVIATLQVKDFLGLDDTGGGEHYWERVHALVDAMPTLRWPDMLIGCATLATLILWPKVTRKLPAPLVAIVLAGCMGWAFAEYAGLEVATIASRFSYMKDGVMHRGIPPLPPMPVLPWREAGPDGAAFVLSWGTVRDLMGPALAIAALGAIESLLSAVVADGMAGTRHDPDAELLGQGLGNLAAPFFGGFAATGAIARTATSIRSGGRSPVAGVVHALFVLAAVLALAPVLGYVPMAGMAALLLVVSWNMSDVGHFVHMLRVAPKSDVLVLLACFGLTVAFDMVIAVSAGIVLAALLFMRRMAEITGARIVAGGAGRAEAALPAGVMQYEIAGPLFFGAAEKAVAALRASADGVKVILIRLEAVPVMDVTGLVALESTIKRLWSSGVKVVLVGARAQPLELFRRAGLVEQPGRLRFCRTMDDAMAFVGGVQPGSPART